MKKCVLFFYFILFLFPFFIFGKVIKSSRSGLWTNAETWENNIVPDENDSVTIQNNHEIEIGNKTHSIKLISLYGSIKFTNSGGRLQCDSLIAWQNSSITGTATAQTTIRSIWVIGSFNLGRGHFNINHLKISAPISLNNNLGNVTIQNLNILPTGVWNNLGNKVCTINQISNKGKFFSGTGKYFLCGDIRSSNLLIFNVIELTYLLNNFDSLEVKTQIIGNQHTLNNQTNAYFASGTTVNNFSGVVLNLKAQNNTFVLNRNSFQTIPSPVDNHFENLILNNTGNANWLNESLYNIKHITVGEKAVVVLNSNRLSSSTNTIVLGEVQTNFRSNEKIKVHLNTFNYQYFSNSIWRWNIIDSVIIDENFSCANLTINASNPAWVKGVKPNLIISGNLNLHQNVRWATDNSIIDLRGSWLGNGMMQDEKSTLKFSNQKLINISINKMNDIEFLNVDSVRFLWNTTAKNLSLHNSKVFLRGINCENLFINNSSQTYISGLNNLIQNIYNQGFVIFNGLSAQTQIKNLINDNDAIWKVENGGNFTIEKSIDNNGEINGCDGTNCNWIFGNSDTIFIKGKGKLFTPRIISNVPYVVNNNFWEISREASGNSKIFNHDTIALGANSNLIQWEVNGKNQMSTVLFNREGVQNIKAEKLTGFTNIGFVNPGRKIIEKNIEINGNLTIYKGCEVYLDTYSITSTNNNYNFTISDTASLTIGKINTIENGGFPNGFKNYNLNINSTVRYQAMGNQVIKGGINYGNIELNCGAVDSAAFTVQNGIFKYQGNLNLLKSALTLIIQQDSALFLGDWLGVGNVHLMNTNLYFYGNGFNTGKLWMDNSKVWYKGDKNQRVKIANYTHVIIDKTNNSKALTRGELGVLNIKKVWVQKGIFSLQTEETFITDSLVIWDKVEVGNTIQNKHLYNITIHSKGIFENLINEDLFFYGNLNNEGTMILDSGKVFFKGNSDILWNNNGKCNLGKIVLENPKTILSGENYYFSNEIKNAQKLYFKNATVNFDSLAFLDSPKYSADEKSVFKGKKYLDKGNIFKAWGWGLELKLDSNSFMGNTIFEQKFDSENLPVKNPLDNYFIIKTDSDKFFNVQMTIDVKEGVEDIEDYKIVKSIDEGMSFFDVPSTFLNNKFIVNDIQEFSWWMGAKGGTTLLNLQLIDFKITPEYISWELVNSKDDQKYIWRYINFDNDTLWLAEKTILAKGKQESFYYTGNIENGCYQLFSIDENNNYSIVKDASYLLRHYRNNDNGVKMLDNVIWFNQKANNISCYNINGQLIDFCEDCDHLSAKNLSNGVYIFSVYFQNQHWIYKYVK
jgi:hypothetical protein